MKCENEISNTVSYWIAKCIKDNSKVKGYSKCAVILTVMWS